MTALRAHRDEPSRAEQSDSRWLLPLAIIVVWALLGVVGLFAIIGRIGGWFCA